MTLLYVFLVAGVVAILLLALAVRMASDETRALPGNIVTALDRRIKDLVDMNVANRSNRSEEPVTNQIVARLMEPVVVTDNCDKCTGSGKIAHQEPPPLVTAILDAYKRLGIEARKPAHR